MKILAVCLICWAEVGMAAEVIDVEPFESAFNDLTASIVRNENTNLYVRCGRSLAAMTSAFTGLNVKAVAYGESERVVVDLLYGSVVGTVNGLRNRSSGGSIEAGRLLHNLLRTVVSGYPVAVRDDHDNEKIQLTQALVVFVTLVGPTDITEVVRERLGQITGQSRLPLLVWLEGVGDKGAREELGKATTEGDKQLVRKLRILSANLSSGRSGGPERGHPSQ
jgi:hypothetical protein